MQFIAHGLTKQPSACMKLPASVKSLFWLTCPQESAQSERTHTSLTSWAETNGCSGSAWTDLKVSKHGWRTCLGKISMPVYSKIPGRDNGGRASLTPGILAWMQWERAVLLRPERCTLEIQDVVSDGQCTRQAVALFQTVTSACRQCM